jgi:hypothetical protein
MRQHFLEHSWRRAQNRIATAWGRSRRLFLRDAGQPAQPTPPVLRASPDSQREQSTLQHTPSVWQEEAIAKVRPARSVPASRDAE